MILSLVNPPSLKTQQVSVNGALSEPERLMSAEGCAVIRLLNSLLTLTDQVYLKTGGW